MVQEYIFSKLLVLEYLSVSSVVVIKFCVFAIFSFWKGFLFGFFFAWVQIKKDMFKGATAFGEKTP